MELEMTRQLALDIMERYHSSDRRIKEEAMVDMLDGLTRLIGRYSMDMFKDLARDQQTNDELMQAGKIAVIEAMPEYDPNISAPSTYFTPYIKSALFKYMSNEVAHMSKHFSCNAKAVSKAIDIFNERGEKYTAEDLSRATGLTPVAIDHALKQIELNTPLCLDEAAGVKSEYYCPETQYEKTELTNALIDGLNGLDDAHKRVIEERFINNDDGVNETNLAERLGMSPEAYRRLLNESLNMLRRNRKLRTFCRENSTGRTILNSMRLNLAPGRETVFLMDEYDLYENQDLGISD